MFNPANIQTGMAVRDRDGEPLGTVTAVDAGGFFIGKGSLFLRDYRVAFSEVMDIDRDDIYLRQDLANLPGVTDEAIARVRGGGPAPLRGGLGLHPRDLEQARMDSAKFQDHGRYDLGTGAARPVDTARADAVREAEPSVVVVQQPPVVVERRVARDGEDTARRDAPPDQDPTWRH